MDEPQQILICPECRQPLAPNQVLPVLGKDGRPHPVCTRCGAMAESIEQWMERAYELTDEGTAIAEVEVDREIRSWVDGQESQLEPAAEEDFSQAPPEEEQTVIQIEEAGDE